MKLTHKRFPIKSQSLLKKVLKIRPEHVIEYPRLITKLNVNDVSVELINELVKKLKIHSDFVIVLAYLTKHHMEHFYVMIFVQHLLTNKFGIINYEKYCYLKDSKDDLSRLIKLKNEIKKDNPNLDRDIHEFNIVYNGPIDYYAYAYKNYELIYFNLSYFVPDIIKYVNHYRVNTYLYFNLARFSCESNFENIKYVKEEAFGNYKRYYQALMYYIHLLNGETYAVDNNAPLTRIFAQYMPVQGNTVELYLNYDIINFNHLHKKHITESNLTIYTVALSQSFGHKFISVKNDTKYKLFKFNDKLFMNSDEVNNIVNIIHRFIYG